MGGGRFLWRNRAVVLRRGSVSVCDDNLCSSRTGIGVYRSIAYPADAGRSATVRPGFSVLRCNYSHVVFSNLILRILDFGNRPIQSRPTFGLTKKSVESQRAGVVVGWIGFN